MGAIGESTFRKIIQGRGRRITRSGVRDQPGQYDEAPAVLKIQKLARYGGGRL